MTSVVALAFALQTSKGVFAPFAAAILPTLFILGCFTLLRLVDVSIQTVQCLRSIARIRQYYRGLTPDAALYFPSTGDIITDAQDLVGYRRDRLPLWFTLAAMIGTVNAVLGGTMVALLVAGVTGAPGLSPSRSGPSLPSCSPWEWLHSKADVSRWPSPTDRADDRCPVRYLGATTSAIR